MSTTANNTRTTSSNLGSSSVSSVAGADHIDVTELRRLLRADPLCRSGVRVRQAHSKLAPAGKQRLHLLVGGMDAWETAGGDVVRGRVLDNLRRAA